jgi:hypothetical protein
MAKRTVGIVWRSGDDVLPEGSRLWPVVRALDAAGMAVLPLAYREDTSAAVRERIGVCDGVLVWVDPLTDGRDRSDLDAILRDAAGRGVWISAHPDTILKMGTKEVLFSTRALGWSGEVALYPRAEALRREFPGRLAASRVRVLKRYRGNGGQGVWKVSLLASDRVRLQEATHRDGTAEELPLSAFLDRCSVYFADDGRLIDQEFQPRITEGMVRAYLSGGELVGFARQYPTGYGGAISSEDTFGLPAAKTMLPPDEPQFQALCARLEREWVPGLQRMLGIADKDLPAIWDADFLFGPRDASGADTFVLCEINVSCITPFPPEAPVKIAAAVSRALNRR